MLEKLKSPAVIISALAFVAMVIVFVAHFQLTGEQAASFEPAPVVDAPADVASAATRTATVTPAPVETSAVTPPAPVPPREVTYEEAEAAYRDGRYGEAVELFTAYSDRKYENPWGFYMLGLSAWKAGDNEAAELAFEQAIELDPNHVKSHINLGRVLLDAGKPTYALVQFHEAIDLDPRSGTAHRLEGAALHAIGKRDEAVGAYRTAIRIDPEDAWAMNNLALVLIETGEYDAALRALARATELRDDVAVFYNNLGMALELNGRFVQATDAYDHAVALDGGYAKAVENYNRVATVLQDPALAPVDLAALAGEFATEVEGWSDTQVASGETQAVEPLEAAVGDTAVPADSTAAGDDR